MRELLRHSVEPAAERWDRSHLELIVGNSVRLQQYFTYLLSVKETVQRDLGAGSEMVLIDRFMNYTGGLFKSN
jgi:hypothetical protein